MKVYIGPYRNWIGPYQIADWLQKVGVSKGKCRKIGKRLADTWLMKFCVWIDSKKKIREKIRIDDYDVWEMDYTLSKIIYPMLKILKDQKHGAPNVCDEDVPDGIGLRSTEAPPAEEWESDDNIFKRWDWVLDEMIWSFEQIRYEKNDDMEYFKLSKEDLDKYNSRLRNGLTLFGKYYMSLWD